MVGLGAAPAEGAITRPQPTSGPGGSDYSHGAYRVNAGGTGNDAWYVFEPTQAAAGDGAAGDRHARLLRVLRLRPDGRRSSATPCRTGDVVIYPRWQTGIADPCPGPFNIEPCMTSAVNGISGALAYLHAPRSAGCSRSCSKTSYFGFSFGGIITANLANR